MKRKKSIITSISLSKQRRLYHRFIKKNSAAVAAATVVVIYLYLFPFPHEWACFFLLWNNAIHFLYTVFILFILLIEHYAWFEHTFLCQMENVVFLSIPLLFVYGVFIWAFLQTVGFYVAKHTYCTVLTHKHLYHRWK